MSIAGFAVVAFAIFFASCMQASIGFGMGMLAAPIVAIVDPALVPGTLIMLATLVSALVLLREGAALDFSGAGWALAGRVPGTIVGALLLVALPEEGLALMLAGVVLLGIVLTSLGWVPLPRKRNLLVAGAASGILGTATSIGGPPMALVWQRNTGAKLRSTMSAFFLVGSILSLITLAVAGAVDWHTAWLFVLLAPATILGYVLSRFVNRVMDRRRLRITAISVSTVGAAVLVIQQLATFR
ncbi:sulfite exporter TauE/SafE family protein [Rhodococcus sp. G-MC3]|uniref:sulfite exporter TauE/SafE family protein n=1 Tax=Rhodococcus sp. G-MC3 TaxID=3046209 RepID=UPI0024B9765E|nr:sulfite exporter TauE/SafE family protein [Rhodococcus sp. G-MC3]MDJ0394651.1 sulfite exporter TauE/SafE family protein [Rhodococcus sp. G-MC3]